MNFAVIQLEQYYEMVEDVRCVKANLTEQEANDLIKKMKDEDNACRKKRSDYIEEFVRKIDVPENLDYEGWKEYISLFFGDNCRYVLPKDFQQELIYYLRKYTPDTLKDIGYDPPIVSGCYLNLFVVEIKG